MPVKTEIIKKAITRTAVILIAFILGIIASGLSGSTASAASPGIDLIVQDISLSPVQPAINDTVTITVTVKNQGSDAAGLNHAVCYVDTTILSTETIQSLDAGTMTTVTFTWKAQPGSHTIKAIADSSEYIHESDETNNTKIFTFSTLAADLIFQSISWSPVNPSKNDNVVFSITVKNQGNYQSGPTVVNFYIDDESKGLRDITSLNPGSTTTVSYNWYAKTGQHIIKAVVDENDIITESNESNNEYTLTFSTLPPDLVIQSITWSPENPSKGDLVTFTIVIKNQGSGRADSCFLGYYIDEEFKPRKHE